jgi:glycosyltransferase involved in cell wall biosynthesis
MKKIKIAIIRGAYVNPWEMQNYEPLKDKFDIKVISSLNPLNVNINLSLVKLLSPMDMPEFPYRMQILNRILIDSHWLYGLEEQLRGVDIAHVAETYFAYSYQSIIAKKKGLVKKIVSTCWEILPHNNEGIRGRREWKKIAYKEIDHFICPTKKAADCLIKEGCEHKKISVVKMGIDLNKFNAQPKASKDLAKSILFVGRLENEKGIWELINAFIDLCLKFKNLKLNIVGCGNEELKLRSFVLKKKLAKNVSFFGNIDYHKVVQFYKNSEIFVLPSKNTPTWQEQYGMVLVEAMASGLAIVTTKSGAIPEVVGNAAVLINPGNELELTVNLERLIKAEDLRHELSKQAIRRSQDEFDCIKTADRIGKLYKKIIVS